MVISIVVMLGIIFTNSNGKKFIFFLNLFDLWSFRTTGAQEYDNNAISTKHFWPQNFIEQERWANNWSDGE